MKYMYRFHFQQSSPKEPFQWLGHLDGSSGPHLEKMDNVRTVGLTGGETEGTPESRVLFSLSLSSQKVRDYQEGLNSDTGREIKNWSSVAAKGRHWWVYSLQVGTWRTHRHLPREWSPAADHHRPWLAEAARGFCGEEPTQGSDFTPKFHHHGSQPQEACSGHAQKEQATGTHTRERVSRHFKIILSIREKGQDWKPNLELREWTIWKFWNLETNAILKWILMGGFNHYANLKESLINWKKGKKYPEWS